MISVRMPKTNPSSNNDVSNILTNISCEVGIGNNCKANQECVKVYPKSRNGVCKCVDGYVLKDRRDGPCEAASQEETESGKLSTLTTNK